MITKGLTVDCHNDLPLYVWKKRREGMRKVVETLYYPDIKAGDIDLIVAAVFVEDMYVPEMALRVALEELIAFQDDIRESSELMAVCTNMKEVADAVKAGKTAFLLSLEGVEPIQTEISLLKVFYELGVRICGLNWSRRNYAADGCSFAVDERVKKSGLTEFGMEIVDAASSLGMLIDVTHMSELAFYDTLERAPHRVIASHTDCCAVNNIRRNFTDAQIRAIAACDGVIGINGVNFIASPDTQNDRIRTLIDHIDHIIKLVGADHVGFGFDLTSYYMPQIRAPFSGTRNVSDLLRNYSYMSELVSGLLERGYSQEAIYKIKGENWCRVLSKLY